MNMTVSVTAAAEGAPFLQPGVILRMPVKIGLAWKLAMIFIVFEIFFQFGIGIWMGRIMFERRFETIWWPFFVCIGSGIFNVYFCCLILTRTPSALDVTLTGVILHTRFTTHSLPFSRMTSIEIVRSAWCYCDFGSTPSGSFTSNTDCILFRSGERGSAIAFSPQDLKQLIETIKHKTQGYQLLDRVDSNV